MPVDPSIALSFKPFQAETPNALADYAMMAKIQEAQTQNQLAKHQLEQERGLTNYLTAADLNTPEGLAGLQQYGKPGLALIKEHRAAKASEAQTEEYKAKAAAARRGMLSQAMRDISANPSDAQITAYLEDVVGSPLFTPDEKASVSKEAKSLLELPFDQRGAILARTGATAGEIMQATKPPAPTDLQRNYEAAKKQGFKGTIFDYEREIKAAGRPPANPPTPAAPVAVIDPESGKTVFVSREEAISKRMTPATQAPVLAPKEIQKREAAHPQATSAVKGFEAKSESFINDLKALRDDPGLDQITGALYGRTPSVSRAGSRAQALYDKIMAKGGFQALQDLRDASKTGGALGNVSNQEGKQLQASFAAIDRRQNIEDVRAALNQAISDVEGARTRMREAYDETYSYREAGNKAAPAAANTPSVDDLLKKYK